MGRVPEKEHCERGGSSASRWLTCPGSIAACHSIVAPESCYAKEGTDAHALGEWCLKTGKEIAEAPEDMRLDSDEGEEAVALYVSECRKQMVEAKGKVWIERQLDLRPILPEDLQSIDLFGTCDFGALAGNTLIATDYKHGKGVAVKVEKNSQMMFYGAGLLAFLQTLDGNTVKPRKVLLRVIQPRCASNAPIQEIEMPVNDLWTWVKDVLVPGIRTTLEPNAPRVADGEVQCRFCPAAGTCPEYREWVSKQAEGDFSPVIGGQIPILKPEALTPEQASRIICNWHFVEEWYNAVEAQAYNAMKSGADYPGLKLVRKRANRAWKPEAEAALVDIFGEREAYSHKLLSPAQAESLAKAMKAPIAIREKIAGLSVKPEGDLTIAPMDDRREAVTVAPAVALDFAGDLLT